MKTTAVGCVCALTLSFVAGSSADKSEPCKVDGAAVPLADVPEASGVAVSRRTPGRLWIHNDSGEPVLLAVDSHGKLTARMRVSGAKVRDWEDVAVGPCSAGSCLYVADVGDNHPSRREVTIYRVAEPAAAELSTTPVEALQGSYPDGPHDAEAMFVTPAGEIVLVTKENPAAVYSFPASAQPGARITLRRVTTLPKSEGRITGASASPDGRWVALRTHKTVSFVPMRELMAGNPGEPIRVDVTSLGEPQGEGVAFGAGGAVFLVGEGGGGHRPGTLARLRCTLR